MVTIISTGVRLLPPTYSVLGTNSDFLDQEKVRPVEFSSLQRCSKCRLTHLIVHTINGPSSKKELWTIPQLFIQKPGSSARLQKFSPRTGDFLVWTKRHPPWLYVYSILVFLKFMAPTVTTSSIFISKKILGRKTVTYVLRYLKLQSFKTHVVVKFRMDLTLVR